MTNRCDDISVTIEAEDDDVPEPGFVRRVVNQARLALGQADAEINVQIIDQQAMQNLNLQYRGHNRPTNVLSFPCELPDWIDSKLIGDIVLCPEIIRQESKLYNQSPQLRWAHLLVHGTLHLLGMNHDEALAQKSMESMEQKIMNELGYQDPYQVAL